MTADPASARRRGQPLAAFGALIAIWVGMRALAWAPLAAPADAPADPNGVATTVAGVRTAAPPPDPLRDILPPAPWPLARTDRAATVAWVSPIMRPPTSIPARPPIAAAAPLPIPSDVQGLPRQLSADQGPSSAPAVSSPADNPMPAPLAGRASRWTGDGWVLYRRGSERGAAAAPFPSYGASQAGGVVRYAIAPASGHAPQLHLRASRALDFAQAEAAAGLSLRALPGLPLRVLGEARVQRDGGRTRLRPAAAVITELPPLALPLRLEGEAYAQAGYVGGKGATAFFDAQATVERPLLDLGPAELRLGGGAWAGGQEGAARVDVGPRATVRLRAGATASRLALDWRFRVAGDARPGSGPAVTFSAGF